MMGPRNTPYEGGLFKIGIFFPYDYPNHGPEFKFLNKIYHLNVSNCIENFGHIDISNINEYRRSGKVPPFKYYNVKKALFDIFCSFDCQNPNCAYDSSMEYLYIHDRKKFNETAKEWTYKYANS